MSLKSAKISWSNPRKPACAPSPAVARALDLPLVAWPDLHEAGGVYEDGPEDGQRIGLPGPDRFVQDHLEASCV